MGGKLVDLATQQLLEKFGAGAHKPGSGSAAAFQGMLSAKLLITVIDLTNDPKRRKNYKAHLDKLLTIHKEINTRLYPLLEVLFQEDSDHFDKVITLRKERDKVDRKKESLLYRQRVDAANMALRQATVLPIQIAQCCYELGKYAEVVFDHGFKSARGDSGVALQCATSGLGGCLSIIELNLTTLPADDWMASIRQKKPSLKAEYEELSALAAAKLAILEKESEENWQLQQGIARYSMGTLGKTIKSDQDMEKLVKDLQNYLWQHRLLIWKKSTISNPMDVIRPQDVLEKVLGYNYIQADSLGMHAIGSDLIEVAGIINKNEKVVAVSKQFSKEIMNFTMAHELGHLILHEQTVLHRDRPFDGYSSVPRSPQEQQADKFAAYFLMPASIVKQVFAEIFKVDKLYLMEATALALGGGNITAFRARCKDRHGFATVVAQVEYYGGKSFNSLAKIFGISAGAMAIRLIELDLVEF